VAREYAVMVRVLEEMHPRWDIDVRPPPEGPTSGAARQAGGSGLIRYAFLEDERGAYLEFYSFHRIWGDLHARIYESGEVQHLAELETAVAVTGDPVEDARLREQQERRNRLLVDELEAAGLLSGGPVPGSFVANAAIVTGLVDGEPLRPEDDADEPAEPAVGDEGERPPPHSSDDHVDDD
jgi:hypothetical protein